MRGGRGGERVGKGGYVCEVARERQRGGERAQVGERVTAAGGGGGEG